METSRPLVVAAAQTEKHAVDSLFTISSPDVLVETVKVSEDRQALILRLFGVSGQNRSVRIRWQSLKPAALWQSDLTERPLTRIGPTIDVPGYEVVTLRADLAGMLLGPSGL
jgi:alpha-mannosidase